MEDDILLQQQYVKAKKRVKEIKGFYIHLLVFCLTNPMIIAVNLIFSPGFHWFWFPLLGMSLGILFHWLGVFGFQLLGFGKDWEARKIKELMKKNNE